MAKTCPYCALDAQAGVMHAVCRHRIELWTEQRTDGWYAVADLNDGKPQMRAGPYKAPAEAQAAADKFAKQALAVLPDGYGIQRLS